MVKHQRNFKKGFTIIEVVLVLAIAGLILLMAITAFPRLQKTTYDTQRKDDVDTLVASLMNYESSNRGILPDATWAGPVQGIADIGDNTAIQQYRSHSNKWFRFYANYILTGSQAFLDPDGTQYGLKVVQCAGTNTGDNCGADAQVYNLKFSGTDSEFQSHTAQNHYIHIVVNATCDGDQAVKSTGPRQFAALYKLEINGTYCAAN